MNKVTGNVALGVSLFCFTLFIVLGAYIYLHPIVGFDVTFSRFLQDKTQASWLLTTNKIFTSSLFRIIYIILIAILIMRKRYKAALLIALAWASEILTLIIKGIVERPRPTATQISIFENRGGFSFNSGHTLEHTLLFGILGLLVLMNVKKSIARDLVVGILFIEPVVVGLGRIYSGAHWLTDVIGSYLLGIAILLIIVLYLNDAFRLR